MRGLLIGRAKSYDARMSARDGFVSIFAGDFPSEEEVERYLEEQYSNDQEPRSRFAGDFGIERYDSDFQEWDHRALRSVASMLTGTSYSSSFLDAAARRAAELGRPVANTIVLLYDFAYEPAGATPDSPLAFIGAFPYDINAPDVERIRDESGA
jgi:hypothetical protein